MEIDDLVDSIKATLGSPVVDIYLNDIMITKLIEKSIRKVASKASPTYTVSKTVVDGKVSLKDLDVAAVRNVYQSTETSDDLSPFGAEFEMQAAWGTKGIYDYISRVGSVSEMRKLLFTDYYLDGDILYLDNYTGTVVVEYVKKNPDLKDMPMDYVSWVESYATALCKEAEGRIRGKFRPQNAPFENDYQDLLSEGQSEKQECESKLEMMMGYWNILR